VPLLPGRIVKTLYKKTISRILAVPSAERDFWNGYLDEIFATRLTKADLLSHFRTGRDTLNKYAFDRPGTTRWDGDVLIIGGALDPASTETDRNKLADFYPHARVCVIPGTGHTVGIQKPDEYAAIVRAFFDT